MKPKLTKTDLTAAVALAWTGRNPKTGQPIIIPEARLVRFTPGIVLREAVKQ